MNESVNGAGKCYWCDFGSLTRTGNCLSVSKQRGSPRPVSQNVFLSSKFAFQLCYNGPVNTLQWCFMRKMVLVHRGLFLLYSATGTNWKQDCGDMQYKALLIHPWCQSAHRGKRKTLSHRPNHTWSSLPL